MDNMFWNSPQFFGLVLALIIFVYYFIKVKRNGLKEELNNAIKKAILFAEKEYGPGKGTIKKKYAIDMVKNSIPAHYRWLLGWITVEYIDELLETIFNQMKKDPQYMEDLNVKP